MVVVSMWNDHKLNYCSLYKNTALISNEIYSNSGSLENIQLSIINYIASKLQAANKKVVCNFTTQFCEPNQNELNVLFLMQSQKVVYKLNTK